MSNTDSFIEEVTEEVRRDRLFGLMRRYGWIAVVIVVALVGGAAVNEWLTARATAKAQAYGDAVLAALQMDDAAARKQALAAVGGEGEIAALTGFLAAADAANQDDRATAVDLLSRLAGDAALPPAYRQLAELKLVMLQRDELDPDARIDRLAQLATPGAPYRLLAEEQMALAEIDAGRREDAIARLQALLQDGDASNGLRRRVTQLIVALGGEPGPA